MQKQTQTPFETLVATLESLDIGAPQTCEPLTIWPLVLPEADTPGDPGPPYLPLAHALEKGSAVVDEVSSGGSIPHVRVRNEGDTAVLVLFGEEILGAKQNRIANATFLVPPLRAVVLDVSCVEAGRWTGTRRAARFQGVGSVVSHSLRSHVSARVARSRAAGGGFTANQGEVWDEVSERLRRSGTRSPSAAYADHYASRADALGRIRAGIRLVDGQVGFVAAIGDEIAGVDLIGRPGVFAACHTRLLDAYAIDAVDSNPTGSGAAVPPDPAAFLARVQQARPSVGASLSAPMVGHIRKLRSNVISYNVIYPRDEPKYRARFRARSKRYIYRNALLGGCSSMAV